MAVDRSRLAAALAYRQAEEERRRRMMESVPVPGAELPTPVPSQNLRRDLENLSIGIGEGLTNQLEGVKGIVTDPIGAARGAYEGVKAVVRDPAIIADALRYTAQKVGSGPLGAGEVIGEMIGPRKTGPVMAELDVYHGTPHRFLATEANPLGEFDASKIGTGEGAQAYGHGVYLAESPDIAKHYQTQLGKFYDQMQTPEGAMSLEEAVTKYHPDGKIAAKVLSTFRTKTDVDTFNKVINDEILPEIRAKYPQSEWGKFAPQQGTLYKADLPDEMIDRMLDWDKPLIEQRPILKALTEMANRDRTGASAVAARTARSILQRAGQAADSYGKDKVTGASLYDSFLADEIPDQAQRSQFLKDLGIPGIRYLDAGSRGQGGSGTRNFVVFPGEEKKVRILERDGQKAPRQKIAQALEAAPRKLETAFDAPEVKPGDIVDGLKVRPEVANVGSIKASLDNYTVLPGIRSVSIADFGEAGPLTGNVDKLDRRTRNLADQITESKEITPLIVVYSGTQNYILEGSHRIDALDALGKKRIPVIAVIDEDDPPKFMRQKR